MLQRFKLLKTKYGGSLSDQLNYYELEDLVSHLLTLLTLGWRTDGYSISNAEIACMCLFCFGLSW